MKTVKEFKDAGLVFVGGDSCDSPIYVNTIGYTCSSRFFLDVCSEANMESFAWRINTGVKPEFVGMIDVKGNNGNIKAYHTDYFTGWHLTHDRSSNGGLFCWLSWRPHLPSIPTETKEEKEALDKLESKPVYTQAMCDNNELPMAGSVVMIKYSGDSSPKFEEAMIEFARGGVGVARMGGMSVCFDTTKHSWNRVEFKPIQTEREKAIEKVTGEWPMADVSTIEVMLDMGYQLLK